MKFRFKHTHTQMKGRDLAYIVSTAIRDGSHVISFLNRPLPDSCAHRSFLLITLNQRFFTLLSSAPCRYRVTTLNTGIAVSCVCFVCVSTFHIQTQLHFEDQTVNYNQHSPIGWKHLFVHFFTIAFVSFISVMIKSRTHKNRSLSSSVGKEKSK